MLIICVDHGFEYFFLRVRAGVEHVIMRITQVAPASLSKLLFKFAYARVHHAVP